MKTVNIAKDFTKYPAGRVESDGPYSGEAFRKKFLEPAMQKKERLRIEFDGARGYGSSFLEEAFGGLVRAGYSAEEINSILELVSIDKSLIREVKCYISDADKIRNQNR